MGTVRNCEFSFDRIGRLVRTVKYILVLLIVWIAPAVLVLAAAVWFAFVKGGKFSRSADGPAESRELSSGEES